MANGILLNIDTTKSEFQNPMVQLRQGDGNYQSLSVTVTSNGEPFDLTGWTITFMGTTAGGFKIVDTASVLTNASQGQFTYTPTKAWGQDEGEFKNAYFKFTKADKTASGASFRVNVLDAVDLTAEEAQNYISVVDALIDNVKSSMDTKLSETKQTLSDTQSQANTVQNNVNDLNTSVNDLKTQNLNIKTTDNTWTGTNTFNKKIISPDGIQGPIDNTSLMNATAFQSLQTQVNNSAVGTNMIQMSNTTAGYVNLDDGNILPADSTLERVTDFIEVEQNQTYCMQQEIYLLAGQYLWFGVGIYDSNKAFIKRPTVTGNNATTNSTDFQKLTMVMPNNAKYVRVSFVTYGYENTRVKLEKGSVATDWCPNPSEILTKVDNGKLVHNTGTETVAGNKTFTGLTSVTNGNSIAPITATITANGITVTFNENAFGVDVNILGTVVGSMVSDDQWKVFSYIPNNISIMKLNMYSNTVITAPISGVTGKTNFKLMFSFNTNREIDYRFTSLRENDTATTYTPTFEVYSSLSWAK